MINIFRTMNSVFTNKITITIIFVYVFIETIIRIDRSWVNESFELSADGNLVVHFSKYWDYAYMAKTLYITMPIMVICAIIIKKKQRSLYGLLEVIVGFAAGEFVVAGQDFSKPTDWISLATTVYLIIRGIENFQKGLDDCKT